MSILDDESIIKNTSFRELDNTLRQQWIMEHGTPVISPSVEQMFENWREVSLPDEMTVVAAPL